MFSRPVLLATVTPLASIFGRLGRFNGGIERATDLVIVVAYVVEFLGHDSVAAGRTVASASILLIAIFARPAS